MVPVSGKTGSRTTKRAARLLVILSVLLNTNASAASCQSCDSPSSRGDFSHCAAQMSELRDERGHETAPHAPEGRDMHCGEGDSSAPPSDILTTRPFSCDHSCCLASPLPGAQAFRQPYILQRADSDSPLQAAATHTVSQASGRFVRIRSEKPLLLRPAYLLVSTLLI